MLCRLGIPEYHVEPTVYRLNELRTTSKNSVRHVRLFSVEKLRGTAYGYTHPGHETKR
jgi:hypothetical protein